jgi:23S rRNA pseudouridine1911/1915/1917 synthase
VGDALYTGPHHQAHLLPRQALHACLLTFVHPFFEKEVTFTSPLPTDLADFYTQWF